MRDPMKAMPPVLRDLTILVVTFVAVTALASAFGAANLGTAASFGQIAFAAALVYAMIRR
jgi:ABC-type methionine transport system permease subunit